MMSQFSTSNPRNNHIIGVQKGHWVYTHLPYVSIYIIMYTIILGVLETHPPMEPRSGDVRDPGCGRCWKFLTPSNISGSVAASAQLTEILSQSSCFVVPKANYFSFCFANNSGGPCQLVQYFKRLCGQGKNGCCSDFLASWCWKSRTCQTVHLQPHCLQTCLFLVAHEVEAF